jgi:hypothetical protein
MRGRETSKADRRVPPPAPEAPHEKRIDALARAVDSFERRLETAAEDRHRPVESTARRLDALSLRVGELESRVEQLLDASAAAPRPDQVLDTVEHLVAARVDGLDQRLNDQLNAIELLRNASAQTDFLLQELISAVEALSEQSLPEGRGPAAEA